MSKKGETTVKHNPKDYTIRWIVSIFPIAFFLIILIAGIAVPDQFKTVLDKGVMLIMKDFGWFISLCTLFFVGFCLLVMLMPIGKIRLGGPNARPALSTFEYFALSLCAGMATGFILWPTAEMVEYTARPPRAFGVEPGSYEAIVDALNFEWLHWAFTPYALYTAFGVVVAYAYYNLRKPYTASSALYPLCGERLGGRGKTIIDVICLFSIIGGVAGSMGYGLLQLGSGLEYLFGVKTGLTSWIVISIVITMIYTGTSVSGLKNGIAWLSENSPTINMVSPWVTTANDVDTAKQLAYQLAVTLKYSTKPILGLTAGYEKSKFSIQLVRDFYDIHEDGQYVCLGLISPISPLSYDDRMLEAIVAYAEEHQTLFFSSAVLPGATGPVTLAGALALANAEMLAGIVLAQLVHPGVPILYGNAAGSADCATSPRQSVLRKPVSRRFMCAARRTSIICRAARAVRCATPSWWMHRPALRRLWSCCPRCWPVLTSSSMARVFWIPTTSSAMISF